MEAPQEFKKPSFIKPMPRKAKSESNTSAEVLDIKNPNDEVSVVSEEKSTPKQMPPERPTISPSEKKARYAAMLAQLKYREPDHAAPFDSNYSLEILKNGSIIDRVNFSPEKRFYVIGRSPGCDIVSEHLTSSRMHAVFQFIGEPKKKDSETSEKPEAESEEVPQVGVDTNDMGMGECKEKGLYIFDLGSTHGTFLNKNQLYPKRYYRLRVGHVLKFGNSTRFFVVTGPSEDEEEESDKTVTELLKERLEKEFERKRQAADFDARDKLLTQLEKVEEDGISWGMADDAVEETDLRVNPFSVDFDSTDTTNFDNPKKTLLGWFEREGYHDELFYDVREKTSGHFICRINLPLDGPAGAPVFAEVDAKGKKKEIVAQCALKACQLLDKYGVLRQSHREGFKRKMKDWEDKDYYSSDEDTYLDRTGSVEKKRTLRMTKAGKIETKTETFESLSEKHATVQREIDVIKRKLAKAESDKLKEDSEADPLDAFMQHLKTGATDIAKFKSKLKELTEDLKQAKKLMDLAAPATTLLPAPRPQIHPKSTSTSSDSDFLTPIKSEKVEITTSVSDIPVAKKLRLAEAFPHNSNEPPAAEQIPVTKTKIPSPLVSKDDVGKDIKIEVDEDPEIANSAAIEEDEADLDTINTEKASEEASKPKRKRNRGRPPPKKPQGPQEFDFNKPEYSNWVPPTDQRGDGWTKLNEKLGY